MMFRAIAVLCVAAVAWAGENWPQFRGPNLDCSVETRTLPSEWSATTNIRWKTPVEGRGWASPVVWGNRVFIANSVLEAEGKDTAPPPNYNSARVGRDSVLRWELHCLDLRTGERLWKQTAHRGNPRIRSHPQNTFASETPVTDGERVYVYFGMVGLFCYDFDGKLLWQKDLGGYPMEGDWGTGSSPILYDGLLYLQVDNEESSFLAAFDAKTGEDRFRIPRDEGSSWSTPFIWKNRLRTELVTNADVVRAYDPKSGEILWQMKYPGGRASASPAANPDMLYIGNERRVDGGGVLVAIRAGASGDITPKGGGNLSAGVAWVNTDGGAEFASPLLYEGKLFLFGRNRGSVQCLNPQTGDPLESPERLPGARSFWSSPWGHDGKVFCIDEAGNGFVLSAGPKVELLGVNELGEEVRATPALINGAIIIRSLGNVYCVGQ